jgi:hypothetical protein
MATHNPCSLTFTRLAPDEETVFSDTFVMREPHGSEFHFEDEAHIDVSDISGALRAAYVAGARDSGGDQCAAHKAFDVALFSAPQAEGEAA